MKVADLYALLSIRPDKASLAASQRVITSVKKGLRTIGVLAGVAAAATVKMVGDTAAVADQYAKMSKQVGISVEGLQQLEFAAQISGTGLQQLRTGLQRFARTADDAGQGLKTAQEPFIRLGVVSHDAQGNLRPLESMLGDVAEAFSKMEDGPEKTALAMKAFGRAGAQLIPLLNEGRAGVDKLKNEFTELGGEISTKQAKAFEEYNDTILRIKTTLTGFRNQAVIALLPQLKKLSKALFVWLKANKDLLKQKLIKFMKAVVEAVKALAKVFGFLIDHGGKIVKVFLIYKGILIALAAKTLILAAITKAAGLTMFTAWVMATLPLVLMIALVVALALVIEDFIGFLTGKDSLIGRVFGEAIEQWKQDMLEFFDWMREKFDVAGDFIKNALGIDTEEQEVQKIQDAADARAGILKSAGVDFSLGGLKPGHRASPEDQILAEIALRGMVDADKRANASAAFTMGLAGGNTGGAGALVGGGSKSTTINFNGMGVDESHRMVKDIVRDNEEATANAIGVDIP